MSKKYLNKNNIDNMMTIEIEKSDIYDQDFDRSAFRSYIIHDLNTATSAEIDQDILERLWNQYSGSFSLSQYYNIVKDYEKKYGFSSETLIRKWKSGKLEFNGDINDWLTMYMQIKDFVL